MSDVLIVFIAAIVVFCAGYYAGYSKACDDDIKDMLRIVRERKANSHD